MSTNVLAVADWRRELPHGAALLDDEPARVCRSAPAASRAGALNDSRCTGVSEIALSAVGRSQARHVVFDGRASRPDGGAGAVGGVGGGGSIACPRRCCRPAAHSERDHDTAAVCRCPVEPTMREWSDWYMRSPAAPSANRIADATRPAKCRARDDRSNAARSSVARRIECHPARTRSRMSSTRASGPDCPSRQCRGVPREHAAGTALGAGARRAPPRNSTCSFRLIVSRCC